MEEGNVCKLCFEIFNEKLRPRVLPCGHSFCTSCIHRLFGNGKLKCPTCNRDHYAVNEDKFPVNYGMEEAISNPKKTESSVAPKARLGAMSNRMQTLIDEQRSTTQNLLLISEKLQSQIKEYDDVLVDKKTKHEEVLQKFNTFINRNEVVIKHINDERKMLNEMQNEVEGLTNEVKQKLPSLDNTIDTKTAIAAIDELDQSFASLEEWNERCQQQLPNANIFTSSNKVMMESTAALSMVDSVIDENFPQIPDLSKTKFTILEKISKICRNSTSTLTLEKFQNMSQALKNLVEEGWVCAIQSKKGSVRSARLSLNEGKIYLHCLQDGEPPAHVHRIKQDELVASLKKDSKLVFMDLAWNGIIQGRVHINLSPDTPLAHQFRILCTGDLGPSYAHSKFFHIGGKDQFYEHINGGDYEKNIGLGGASVIKGLNRNYGSYKRPYIAGIVCAGHSLGDGPQQAQFKITTGKGYDNCTASCVFGQVQDGLNILKAATNIAARSVEMVDCGVVLNL